jgi:hypothetical protein
MADDRYRHQSRLTVHLDLYHDEPGEDLAEDAAIALKRHLRDRHDCRVESWTGWSEPIGVDTRTSD